MNNPPHPGGGLRYDIEAMGWTVAECARRLGLSRATLSRVLNGKQAITPAIALALEEIGWSDAETWLRLQATYDLARSTPRSSPGSVAPAVEAQVIPWADPFPTGRP